MFFVLFSNLKVKIQCSGSNSIYFYFRSLNQHLKVAGILLRQLVQIKIIDFLVVLETYTSRVQCVSTESVQCLECGLMLTHIGQTENHLKEKLMRYILNSTNSGDFSYLSHKETARFLVNILLKKWPETEKNLENTFQSDIIDIHLKSLMTTVLVLPKETKDFEPQKVHSNNIDKGVYEKLLECLENFANEIPNKLEITIGTLILLTNILGYTIDYGIVSVDNVETNPIVGFIKKVFQNDNLLYLKSYREDRETPKFLECIHSLGILFSFSSTKLITSLIKKLVPVDLLTTLLRLLNELQGKNCK